MTNDSSPLLVNSTDCLAQMKAMMLGNSEPRHGALLMSDRSMPIDANDPIVGANKLLLMELIFLIGVGDEAVPRRAGVRVGKASDKSGC
jgi:hypothetical protein